MNNLSSIAIGLTPADAVNFLDELAIRNRNNSSLGALGSSFELKQYASYIVLSFKNVDWYSCSRDAIWMMSYFEVLKTLGHPVVFLQICPTDSTEWLCNGGEKMLYHCFKLNSKNCCIDFKPTTVGA